LAGVVDVVGYATSDSYTVHIHVFARCSLSRDVPTALSEWSNATQTIPLQKL